MTTDPRIRNDLIVVAPVDKVSRLIKAGFKPAGRTNQYTTTLFRTYVDPEFAMTDGRAMPSDCVWAVEQVREV